MDRNPDGQAGTRSAGGPGMSACLRALGPIATPARWVLNGEYISVDV